MIRLILIAICLLSSCRQVLADDSVHGLAGTARSALAKNDYKKALPLVRVLAANGNREFQFEYGRMLLRGRGTAIDTRQAFSLLTKAAAASYAPAQDLLAEMYEEGEGTEVNENKSIELWRDAAAQGDVRAEYKLGGYYMGLGDGKSFAEGFELLKRAAKQGDPAASYDVVAAFYDGRMPYLKKDQKAAVAWCQIGIKNHCDDCASMLARMYMRGEGGLPQDRARAFLAASQFDQSPESLSWRDRVKKTPSQANIDAAMKWYLAKRNAESQAQTSADTELWDVLNRK